MTSDGAADGPAGADSPAGAGGAVALAPHTTLRIGGPARRFVVADTDADLAAQARAADERAEPLLVLGGGSNLVVGDDGFPGTVVRAATRGISRADGGARVTVAAGEDWDGVVAWSAAEGLAGLECLSGIPGSAGATPVQNVGAYGQEVAQTVLAVRVYDRLRREITELSAAECGFGYRDSVFKRSARAGETISPTGRYVVLSVTFELERSPLSRPVRYAELARVLGIAEGGRAPLADVRAAVLALRRAKGMVLDPADPDTRSAGSFFTNPVLSQAGLAALERAVAVALGEGVRVPRFPAEDGRVKIPAAWLIERAGFAKGYPGNGSAGRGGPGPRISAKHTLALVNPGGATSASVLGLAREIRDGVRKSFGVELVPEPTLVGVSLDSP